MAKKHMKVWINLCVCILIQQRGSELIIEVGDKSATWIAYICNMNCLPQQNSSPDYACNSDHCSKPNSGGLLAINWICWARFGGELIPQSTSPCVFSISKTHPKRRRWRDVDYEKAGGFVGGWRLEVVVTITIVWSFRLEAEGDGDGDGDGTRRGRRGRATT